MKRRLFWTKICVIFTAHKALKMSKRISKYKISSSILKKANSMLIRNGISEKTRNSYNGEIHVQYHTKNGIVRKSFTNSDIKQAFEKALNTYAERI
jgi:hypothetical protein